MRQNDESIYLNKRVSNDLEFRPWIDLFSAYKTTKQTTYFSSDSIFYYFYLFKKL